MEFWHPGRLQVDAPSWVIFVGIVLSMNFLMYKKGRPLVSSAKVTSMLYICRFPQYVFLRVYKGMHYGWRLSHTLYIYTVFSQYEFFDVE